MSGVKLEGNALGTGVFTIKSPNSNTDRTFNLPDVAGTLLNSNSPASDLPSSIKGPTFSAYQSSTQTISAATWTKLQVQTEEWDTNSSYDVSTYRFTPTVAGYYQVNGSIYWTTAGTTIFSIYKNGGALTKRGNTSSGTTNLQQVVSALIYLNGSTDYVELWAYHSAGSTTVAQQDTIYFQASLTRLA